MVSIKKLGLSFRCAFEGLRIAFKEEQSFRIQVLVAILGLFLMFYLPLASFERAILILTVMVVLSLELINTQVERVLDFCEPNHNPLIKKIKDLSAAAVLVVVFGAILIGFLIFFPYF